MEEIVLPHQVVTLMTLLVERNYHCFVAGEAVQALLTGKKPMDYDIITDADMERLLIIFEGYRMIEDNVRRGELIVMVQGMAIMVSPYRSGFNEDGTPICTDSITAELARRDFTLNAICVGLNGAIFDPLGGAQCLETAPYRLRAIGEGETTEVGGSSIQRDPMNIMRAIALVASGEYILDEATKLSISTHADSVCKIEKNRLRMAFEEILMAKRGGDALFQNKEVVFAIFPELADADGFDQRSAFQAYPLYEHVCRSVQCSSPDLALRYALLFHGAGKPDCEAVYGEGYATFFGHCERACIKLRNALRRLNAPPELISDAVFLIQNHDIAEVMAEEEPETLLEQMPPADIKNILLFACANLRAKSPDNEQKAAAIKRLADQVARAAHRV